MRLIDDVVAGDRLLALVATRDGSVEAPGLRRHLRGRHRRDRPQDDQGARRDAAHPRPGPRPRAPRPPDRHRPVPARRVQRAARHRRRDARAGGADPERPGAVRRASSASRRTCPRSCELAAANVDDPSALAHLVASTLRSIKTEERQELLETLDVEERLRKVSAILSRELEVFELGSKIQSQVQSEMEKGQREYFLRQQLKAIQQELGEDDPEQAEVERAARAAGRADRAARRRPRGRRARARAARAAAAGRRRVRRHPHLSRVDPDAAVGRLHARQPRSGARAEGARRRPLRPREGEGPHRRVPGRRQAAQRGLRPDPLLRRPARRRQDVARAFDRERARSQVRSALGRRRARRVGDPRSSAHLHRLDARHDHPLVARRRLGEPARC